ncbi:PKD domain-containing protein [Nocardioides campestrisoli]|uniref:PKD domain-containing protein n=1 Tax=Nocardioides campestrisoli TaxID=2736757 RepID=UPI00163D6F89|nr:PKD domain-containing protein [Nocardioides campestrisoli]
MKSGFGRALMLMLTGGLAALVGVVGQLPAMAVDQPGGQLVQERAAARTPHVLDGMVYSVAEAGGQIVLGGDFTKARNDGTSAQLPRTNLLAFNPADGRVSTGFVPQPNGVVRVVLPAADGKSVYVGGKFTSIGGENRKNLAQVRISDGAVLPFDAGKIAGQVRDLRLAGGRLWIAGHFTHVGGHAQTALATVDARSGTFLPFMRLGIAGNHNSGATNVLKIDVSPRGDRLVAVGNFDTVDGVVRHQLMQLDISGDAARASTLNTRFFTATCSRSFDTYMRDVDYSPDGSFFVVTTTGGYGGADAPCDSTSRFETYAAGATVQPSWVNLTGGDTLYAVEVTDSVVYVGGHFRWQNNPFAGDLASFGAVPREGIAALDPANGLPYSWNPGRSRGIGVFDFLVTEAGLWVASDTDRIGTDRQTRARIALLPTGGLTVPPVRSARLPNDIYTVGASTVTARSYRGGTVGAARPVSGLSASSVKGAFMVNGWLYLAQSDGTFVRRTFDGTTFGAAERVDTADRLKADATWQEDLRKVTGMFFDDGRIYYTLAGSNELRYRYFTPESAVVGAKRLVASGNVSGISFSGVRGMFLADGKLYWSDGQGVLRRIDWRSGGQSGVPVAGTAAAVSGPQIDRVSWTSRDLFVFQDAQGRGAVMEPQAAFEVGCTSLTCSFDGTSSLTPGGEVAKYVWDFGDGATATGPRPQHVYTQGGTFQVRLTITSTRDQSATVTRAVQVTRVNQRPVAVFTASCQSTLCAFDASASSDAEGPVTYAWDFGDNTSGTGVSPTKVYSAEGAYRVTLTVTDSDRVTHSVTQDVAANLAKVQFVSAASANGNSTTHRVGLPAQVAPGDVMVLTLALNSDVAITDPEGWTPLESVAAGGVSGRSWWRRAEAGDAGSNVRVSVGAAAKGDLSVAAYRGSEGRLAYVAQQQAKAHTSRGTEFTSPQVTAPAGGGWLVTYWALKSPDEASWREIGGQTARATSSGVGSGRITATVADSAGPVPAGQTGGLVGRTTVEVPRAIVFSTALGLQ